MSTATIVAPSMRLSAVRNGSTRSSHQRPSRSRTSRSHGCTEAITCSMIAADAVDRERELDVLERTADVGRQQVEGPLRGRRQPADAQVAADGDHRQVGAADEVRQVVGQRVELAIAAEELLVDRRQLLVRRLQFLLGGLQLFVGALQLLVARQHFLVRRAQLLAGGLLLVDDRLQVLLGRRQFLPQPGGVAVGVAGQALVLRERAAPTRPASPSIRTAPAGSTRRWCGTPDRQDAQRELDVVAAVRRRAAVRARPGAFVALASVRALRSSMNSPSFAMRRMLVVGWPLGASRYGEVRPRNCCTSKSWFTRTLGGA